MVGLPLRRLPRIPRPLHLGVGLLGLTLCVPAFGLAEDTVDTLTLPETTAETPPELRCHLVVRQDAILVDGVQVVSLVQQQDEEGGTVLAVSDDERRGMMIPQLYDRLLDKMEQEKLYDDAYQTLSVLTQRRDQSPRGELLVSIDKDVPFSVVREVLYSAGQAQWSTFLLVGENPWEDAMRTVEIALPRIGPPPSYEPDEDPPLNLAILVNDEGLTIMGADAVLFPDGAPTAGTDAPAPTVPCASGGACTGVDDYAWAELSRLLGLVKDEHPDELWVIVLPESDVSYELVVRVLDHARWAPYLPMDAEQGAWEYWKSVRRELFPVPTLAGGAG